DQTGHAIHASIPAGNDTHRLTGQGPLNSELGAGHFLGQGQRNALLVAHEICHPGKIALVSNDHIRALQRCLSLPGKQRRRAWPKTNNTETSSLTHTLSFCCPATRVLLSWCKITMEK